MSLDRKIEYTLWVTPRMRRVSRNCKEYEDKLEECVTPRMRRVSRNANIGEQAILNKVTPRMRRVSRNLSGE